MLRVELFVLIGIAVGIPLGVVGSWLVRMYLARRDADRLAHVTKIRVEDQLHRVQTEDLLDELSMRDDLNMKNRKR